MLTGLQRLLHTESSAGLLKNKVMELGSALFFTESESLLKLPTHVINAVEMDAEEQIWFVIPRPAQQVSEFDHALPAKLDFFKKGKEFYIKVKGVASIVTDHAEIKKLVDISGEMRERMLDQELVAVKVKIGSIICIDTATKPEQNRLQNRKLYLSSWLF